MVQQVREATWLHQDLSACPTFEQWMCKYSCPLAVEHTKNRTLVGLSLVPSNMAARGTDEALRRNLEANAGFLGTAEDVAKTFSKGMFLQRLERSSASEGIHQRKTMKITPQIVIFNIS